MPFPDDDAPAQGRWEERVAFLPTGEAVTPGWLIVANEDVDAAVEVLIEVAAFEPVLEESRRFGGARYTLLRAERDADLVEAIDVLHQAGIRGQPSHVLFADCLGLSANPVYANPVYANPVYANAAAVPVGFGCQCCCPPHPASAGEPSGPIASPVYANPVYANPAYANEYRTTGVRRSTARPAAEPRPWTQVEAENPEVVVAILDTGMAREGFRPVLFQGDAGNVFLGDEPDEDVDDVLDPAAGHGTFIAGLIRRLAPSVLLKSIRVLSTLGDGKEPEIAFRIDNLADEEGRVDLLNLSFGGYSSTQMAPVAEAIRHLQRTKGTVVVASAGNDGTCVPTWPAIVPAVVAVGALDSVGNPAVFSNFGPWVRAWARGTDVVSAFFDHVDADDPVPAFDDWATWSGTSFAAPIVTGMIARRMIEAGIESRTALAALKSEAAAAFDHGGMRIDLPPEA